MLWDEEIKCAESVPGAQHYKVKDHMVKNTKYNNTHLGTDVKTCEKMIKYAPGPGSYNNDSTRGRSFNYKALNGPVGGDHLLLGGNSSIAPSLN